MYQEIPEAKGKVLIHPMSSNNRTFYIHVETNSMPHIKFISENINI